MKSFIFSILIAVLCLGCGGADSGEAISPDGKLKVRTEISGNEASPTKRLCVILVFEDLEGKEKRIQTGVSDVMKWALDWHDSDTLILYSSDIGTTAYDIDGLEISERLPTKEEIITGKESYRNRYGKLPNT